MIGCFMRQVRVLPQPVEGSPMDGSRILPVQQIYPEFSEGIQDKTLRVWNNSKGKTLQEGWLKSRSTNAFLKDVESPPFTGSRLIGSEYSGQQGQVFGGDCDYGTNLSHTCNSKPDFTRGPWPGYWNGFNSPFPDGSKFGNIDITCCNTHNIYM